MYNNFEEQAERQHYNECDARENARRDSIYIVGPCDQCGYGIKSDENYCETCDGHFCSHECFEEYYHIKHCEKADKPLDCGHKSSQYIDTDIGTFCTIDCMKDERGFKEYDYKYI